METVLMYQKGMTLVEVLVVIALMSFIGMLVVNMFIASNRTYMDQNRILDTQRSGRIAMENMARVLRETGLDPCGAGRISGNPDGLYLFGMREAAAGKVRITRDVNVNGQLDPAEDLAFEKVGANLQRSIDGGSPIAIAANVAEFRVTFLNENDEVLAASVTGSDLNRIRSMLIELTLEDDKVSGGKFDRSYKTRVYCRNLFR